MVRRNGWGRGKGEGGEVTADRADGAGRDEVSTNCLRGGLALRN